ncbi:hypothetical protein [Aureimonas sp. SK2]|uniref:hypothetical protein n=1 Tax=Aureimonas sp. SK2 TaxID=3015992 RepID=UPI002445397D|nr:hypothetical protein [Aureimonas sp. SK2]
MGTIEINMRHAERDIRFAKLRTPREDGPLSRWGLRMLVEMSANDLRAHYGTFDCLEMRRDIIDKINEGMKRGYFQRPAAADLNEILDMDLLKARCELEAFRFEAEGGNRAAPLEVEEPLTPR